MNGKTGMGGMGLWREPFQTDTYPMATADGMIWHFYYGMWDVVQADWALWGVTNDKKY